MVRFQERFLFYLNRCERLLQDPRTAQSEVRQYTDDELNTAAQMLFEMAFTNYTKTTDDFEHIQSMHDVQEIYNYKREKYAEKLSVILTEVIGEDIY